MSTSNNIDNSVEKRLLAQLLSAQGVLQAFAETRTLSEFVARLLLDVPGIGESSICLRDLDKPIVSPLDALCQDCAVFGSAEDARQLPLCLCLSADRTEISSLPIRTPGMLYGYMVLKVVDARQLAPYMVHLQNFSNFTAMVMENTRQKAKLEMSNASLESEIAERKLIEKALHGAKAEAEAANESKSSFLASISHDLRTPLNAILGFSEMMKGKMFGPLGDSHYEEYASDIHDSGRFLLDLINDILDLSKAEAGKFELVEGVMDLGACIQASARLISPLTDRKNIHLSVDVPADMPPFLGDERTITQIINNLLSNAVKFTDENGEVSVSAKISEQGGVDICVADNGVGMSRDDIAQAMEPFVQTEGTLSHSQEGTGLGLSLCKTFVELHGGTLTIESAPGEGTTIIARFPPKRSAAL